MFLSVDVDFVYTDAILVFLLYVFDDLGCFLYVVCEKFSSYFKGVCDFVAFS